MRAFVRDLRRVRSSESGITIVEAMIAAAILLVVLLGGFLALESASSATKTAERQAIAASVGEREIERLLNLNWNQLVHCAGPPHAADPIAVQGGVAENPLHYVVEGTQTRFQILDNYRVAGSPVLAGTPANGEEIVRPSDSCPSGAMAANASPDNTAVPFSSGGVTGSVYRFITWRQDTCPPVLVDELEGLVNQVSGLISGILGLLNSITSAIDVQLNPFCLGTVKDSKRITVAVVVDGAGDFGPRKPTWMSTIHTNPSGGLIIGGDGTFSFSG